MPEASIRGDVIGYDRVAVEVLHVRARLDALFANLDADGATHDDDWTAVTVQWR